MSLEDTIAQAATEVGEAREEILGLVNVAQAQITRIGDTYDDILSSAQVVVYLDQENGSDNNSGLVSAEPLASVGQALSLCPRGGEVRIILLNDYTFTEDAAVVAKTVVFESQGATKFEINFDMHVTGANAFRLRHGIEIDNASQLFFNNVTVVVGEQASAKTIGYASAAIRDYPARSSGIVRVKFAGCDMVRPAANGWSPLIASRVGLILTVSDNTETDQPMDGWWWQDASSPTDPATLNNVLTNLVSL